MIDQLTCIAVLFALAAVYFLWAVVSVVWSMFRRLVIRRLITKLTKTTSQVYRTTTTT